MKKNLSILIIATILCLFSGATSSLFAFGNSEGSVYAKGDMLGSLGLSIHYFGLYGAFDYGVHDCISAGIAIGYNRFNYLSNRTNRLPIIGRVAFHPFNLAAIADKIIVRNIVDVYVGLGTGIVISKEKNGFGEQPTETLFRIREYIGMRYHFSDNFSLFVEDCAEIANIAAGVTYRF